MSHTVRKCAVRYCGSAPAVQKGLFSLPVKGDRRSHAPRVFTVSSYVNLVADDEKFVLLKENEENRANSK